MSAAQADKLGLGSPIVCGRVTTHGTHLRTVGGRNNHDQFPGPKRFVPSEPQDLSPSGREDGAIQPRFATSAIRLKLSSIIRLGLGAFRHVLNRQILKNKDLITRLRHQKMAYLMGVVPSDVGFVGVVSSGALIGFLLVL